MIHVHGGIHPPWKYNEPFRIADVLRDENASGGSSRDALCFHCAIALGIVILASRVHMLL